MGDSGLPRPKIDVVLQGFGFTCDQGTPGFCSVVMVEGPDRAGRPTRILVDAAHVGRRTFLSEALTARGLAPDDIDMLVLTHAHWDHVQNIDVFERSTLCLHPDERRYAHRPHRNDWATPKWTGAILDLMPTREVGEGEELIPGVRIVELRGHSPGSIGVTVETERGLEIITGDALHFASVAKTGRNPLVFWSAEQASRSIQRVLKSADVIYPGHDQPFRMTGAGEIEYVTPFQMTIKGVTPQTPGLSFSMEPREVWVMPGIEEQRVPETV
jgi:N-acyl homoserine lactone hydrolase